MLRGADITITKDEAATIVDEVMDHPKDLMDSITNLAKAFKESSDT